MYFTTAVSSAVLVPRRQLQGPADGAKCERYVVASKDEMLHILTTEIISNFVSTLWQYLYDTPVTLLNKI
jgi:hypothetical protein